MKKINRLLIGSLAIPTSALSLMPLVSCGGNNEKALTLDLQHDNNVESLTTDGELLTNKAFKVIVNRKSGWHIIDTTNTYVEVDGRRLTQGSDKDYEIKGNDTIQIHANVIKSTNVTVYVAVLASYKSAKDEWQNTSSFKLSGSWLLVLPNQKISKNNLKLTITNGDGRSFEAQCGTGNEQYTMSAKSSDITTQFAGEGWSYDESVFEGHSKLVTLDLAYTYKDSAGTHYQGLTAMAGKSPTQLTIKGTEESVRVGESIGLNCSASTNEFPYADYQIISEGTTATDTTLQKDEDGDWTLTAGTIPGVVKIKATSWFDSSVTAEGTFTIKASE